MVFGVVGNQYFHHNQILSISAAQQDKGRRFSIFNFGTNCPRPCAHKYGSGGIFPVAAYRSEQPGVVWQRYISIAVYRWLALDRRGHILTLFPMIGKGCEDMAEILHLLACGIFRYSLEIERLPIRFWPQKIFCILNHTEQPVLREHQKTSVHIIYRHTLQVHCNMS